MAPSQTWLFNSGLVDPNVPSLALSNPYQVVLLQQAPLPASLFFTRQSLTNIHGETLFFLIMIDCPYAYYFRGQCVHEITI